MIELDSYESMGSKLLPLYTFDAETGEWEHGADDFGKRGRRWLGDFDPFALHGSAISASANGGQNASEPIR